MTAWYRRGSVLSFADTGEASSLVCVTSGYLYVEGVIVISGKYVRLRCLDFRSEYLKLQPCLGYLYPYT